MEYVRYFVIFNRLRRRKRFSNILIISELSTDSIDYFCYLKPGAFLCDCTRTTWSRSDIHDKTERDKPMILFLEWRPWISTRGRRRVGRLPKR